MGRPKNIVPPEVVEMEEKIKANLTRLKELGVNFIHFSYDKNPENDISRAQISKLISGKYAHYIDAKRLKWLLEESSKLLEKFNV